jgi:hypothetical protein
VGIAQKIEGNCLFGVAKMVNWDIVYIKTEPIPQGTACRFSNAPKYRCTIELIDGSTIMRCGGTVQHALANAVACYKTSTKFKLPKP